MKIHADSKVRFGRDLCFRTYRDELDQLVPFLPNVTEIKVLEAESPVDGDAKKTRKLNEWRAVTEVPKVVATVLKPEMLAWHDHALWDERAHTCHWRIETHFFTERIKCEGVNHFLEDGDGMRLEIRGELDIDLKGLAGVPKLLAPKAGKMIEKFVVTLLTPNLTSVSAGLEKYLETRT